MVYSITVSKGNYILFENIFVVVFCNELLTRRWIACIIYLLCDVNFIKLYSRSGVYLTNYLKLDECSVFMTIYRLCFVSCFLLLSTHFCVPLFRTMIYMKTIFWLVYFILDQIVDHNSKFNISSCFGKT